MDTPQPETAGETELASDPYLGAAEAFKAMEAPERPRGPDGKFVSAQEIEAEAEGEIPEAEAESPEAEVSEEEQPEEAQPDAVELPPSWPAELAEEWTSLPAKVQDKIVQREAEREAAVNAKFQEAANVRKANEATITEAQQSRQRFVEAADHVLSMIQPQRPPLSMLSQGSPDYNPDHYHLLNAQADQAERLLSQVSQQRHEAIAQLTKDAEAQAYQEMAEIEAKSRPALLKDVPELTDPQKYNQALGGIVQYAIQNGIPQAVFADPEQAKYVTSAQIHLAWKAQQFDKMMAAKAKVQPKAPKPAAPPVRPGVVTGKSQAEAVQRKSVMERLKKEGSIEAGADAFKLFMRK